MHDENLSAPMDRRKFLKTTADVGAALALGSQVPAYAASPDADPVPTRVLGRTGARVSVLGLGTAPVGEGPIDVQQGIKIFRAAMDRGVNYIDTARGYGNAEEILGHLVPRQRDKLFLVTKAWTESGSEAETLLNESMRQLRTDYIDLVHIHNVGNKDIDKVLAKDGILAYLLRQKASGRIRFIGVTSHCRPDRVVRMLETGQIDVAMTVINYADVFTYDFHAKILPAARKHDVALAAMKVYVGIKGGFRNHRKASVGCVTPRERMPRALAFALDLERVAVAVVGPYSAEQAIHNVELAGQYQPLTSEERAGLLETGRHIAPDLGTRYGPLA